MNSIQSSLEEEIALEGLDGITLDSLWFRLSERLKLSLPYHENFKNKLWKIVVKRPCFQLYQIAESRETVCHLDRLKYVENDEEAIKQAELFFSIYKWAPVEDAYETGVIRGSCSEYKTRILLNRAELEKMDVAKLNQTFGQKLVIVASQKLRNNVLFPANINRDVDINSQAYSFLERVGRARHFGEATSGPFSIHTFIKDAKMIHYLRTCIVKNNLAYRQQYTQKVATKTTVIQLFHLPNYYVAVQSIQARHIEKLFEHLKCKENNIASLDEVRTILDLGSKTTVFSIRSRPDIFEYRQFPYIEVYPNASKEEAQFKKGNERKVVAVKLVNPNGDISELYSQSFKKDQDAEEHEDQGFLDVSKQSVRRPLVHQVVDKIEASKGEGISQTDIGNYFGLSRLNARSVVRKTTRYMNITFYLKDEGRQRVSRYVCKEHVNAKNQEFVDEIAKLLKKSEENSNDSTPLVNYEELSIDANEFSPSGPSSAINKIKRERSPAASSVINFIEPVPNVPANDTNFAVPQTPAPCSNYDEVVVMPESNCSFVDNIQDVKVTLTFLNNVPGAQKNVQGLEEAIAQNKVSTKVLSRMNIILDVLKEKTVVDVINLLQTIRQKETDLNESCCRKSMLTLCGRLNADRLLKVIQMELTSVTNVVKLIFFGEPTVTFDMGLWNSIIEEQKIQHFISVPRPIIKKEDKHDVMLVPSCSAESGVSVVVDEYDAQSTRHENFPKFMKYRLFHEFLFYLIYNYPSEIEKIPVKRVIEVWKRENQRITDYDEIAESISTCYSTEISWKMFIPPLNRQQEYGDGWGFLRDIIHRIPLILFVKFTRYATYTPELKEYIMHPIKCNYLLHFLPTKLRTHLMKGRKFIACVVELCKRLCWMGLLQFGPSRTKEIDQTYIYLNRNAMLLDTRISEVGYLEVSEQEYTKLSFHFDSSDAVSNYWTVMLDVCVNTKINKKSTAFGQTIVVEPLSSKPDVLAALAVQTVTSAPQNDIGEIPGDRKGAGGLDKAFMAHLRQSWSRTIDKQKNSAFSVADRAKKKIAEAKKIRKRAPKIKSSESAAKPLQSRNLAGVSLKSKIIRKVKPKKMSVKEMRKKGMLLDEVDIATIRLKKTLRVAWSEIEDKTLLLAKVAMKFAFPIEAQRSHYVSSSLIRDILHWRTERALNKTSKACQRRLSYLTKNNKQFKEQTFLYLEELNTNHGFVSKYHNFAQRLKKLYNQEQIYMAVKIHLIEMVHQLHQIFFKQFLDGSTPIDQQSCIDIHLPRRYDELLEKFKIVNPNTLIAENRYEEPKNSKEIEISVLSSLIHSAVCSTNDKISNSYFLLEAYKKFNDENLGLAVGQLRQLSVVSLNKTQRSREKVIMPYSISPFHLSNRYSTVLHNIHVPVELYDEYLDAMKILSNSEGEYPMNSPQCGWLFMVAEMLSSGKITLSGDLTSAETQTKKISMFDQISENYLTMKRNKEEEKHANKTARMFRLPVDNNSDDKYIFNDDPLEIFFKLDSRYLHIFCLLQSIEHHQSSESEKWSINEENEECTFKHCIIRAGGNFSIEIQKIACQCFNIIKNILNDDEPGPSKYDENSISKHNLVEFFDTFINKYSEEKKESARKDLGKSNSMEFHHKVTTKFLLSEIQRLSSVTDIEDGAWLSDYKKISHKNEDEIFDDEEDIVDVSNERSIKQRNEANTSVKTSGEPFTVNITSVLVNLKHEPGVDKSVIDGETIEKKLVPFSEQERTDMIESISARYVWSTNSLIKRTFEEDTANIIVPDDIKSLMSDICQFLMSNGQDGAKVNDLLEHFGEEGKERLHKSIDCLIDNKLVLRTGVTETRFVHKDFADFWLVSTFYLTAKDAETDEPPKKNRKTDDTHVQDSNCDDVPMEIEPDTSKQKGSEKKTAEEKQNLARNPYYLLPSPWVRVGALKRTLNRRCLDKWLGTVLNHISVNPGVLLSDLCLRFNIITPVHMLMLCEVLESIGCVKLMAFSPPEINIFSDYYDSTDEVKPATHLDTFDRTFIEINTDAFHRLTFFIGNRKYRVPFI